jgi:hypothetical protein
MPARVAERASSKLASREVWRNCGRTPGGRVSEAGITVVQGICRWIANRRGDPAAYAEVAFAASSLAGW